MSISIGMHRQTKTPGGSKTYFGVMRHAECRDFGDVITFDTTHKTNKHNMPLAMFVGCNNQLQNVVFGQALLRDEASQTFTWLFTTLKTCMGGQEPSVLLTG
jgi:hypothetical protein